MITRNSSLLHGGLGLLIAFGILSSNGFGQAGIVAPRATFHPPEVGYSDNFGTSISISGNTMVVGTPYEDSAATGVGGNQLDNSATSSGAAFVFVQSGGTWILEAYLKASNTEAGDQFGRSVSISGDTVVVGAALEASAATGINGDESDNSLAVAGAAYVFVRNAGVWTQQAYLKASNTNASDYFGETVSVDGDRIAVGAIGEDSDAVGVNGTGTPGAANLSGAAYFFSRTGTSWSQDAYVKASNTGANDRFGAAVQVSGDTIAVGAKWEGSPSTGVGGSQGDGALGSGAVYAFHWSGAAWIQQAYIKASNTQAGQDFGSAVALDGDTLVVGAPDEGSLSPGVNGNQNYSGTWGAGAAYVFIRSGVTWSQEAYVKASNPQIGTDPLYFNGAHFGSSVAVRSGKIIVGAVDEDGCSWGVDGNQDSTDCGGGAAYVFERESGMWAEKAYIRAGPEGGGAMGMSVGVDGDLACISAAKESALVSGSSLWGVGSVHTFDLNATCGVTRYGDYVYGNQYADIYSYSEPLVGGSLDILFDSGYPYTWNGPLAFLVLSAAPVDMPGLGGTLYVDLSQSYLGGAILPIPLVKGTGTLSIPIPPGIGGIAVYAQAATVDPTHTFGLTLSQGLRIDICP